MKEGWNNEFGGIEEQVIRKAISDIWRKDYIKKKKDSTKGEGNRWIDEEVNERKEKEIKKRNSIRQNCKGAITP